MRVSIIELKEMKQKGEKIPMLTAYDYATAKLIDEAGVDVIHGHSSHHVKGIEVYAAGQV